MKKNKLLVIIPLCVILIFIYQNVAFGMETKQETQKILLASTIDDIMGQADEFVKNGEATYNIDEKGLGETSDFLYNSLLAIGIVVAVAVGIVLGIKYMLGSLEEKAEYKQTLLAYVISCSVVFGAFAIWRLAINVLANV